MHIAIILDGNGRWAVARHQPRLLGHRAGTQAVRRAIHAAPGLGIRTLSLYAFSSDNWKRPAAEVAGLMALLGEFVVRETASLIQNGVRLTFIGRRDRLSAALAASLAEAESATAAGARLHLRIALDYSAREAITRGEVGPDVDLLIRTGGEQRLSDFLLWECAYAELLFVPQYWPDFSPADLAAAVSEFGKRERRFGAVPAYC
ncbi:MAG: di-trans,poly-cis-decaprenylcistransferase [Bryobacteraceae bacterium]|nr:di-trans,poly-cis-decaprenylcistransferase [Bryobacteraceae bacterium]